MLSKSINTIRLNVNIRYLKSLITFLLAICWRCHKEKSASPALNSKFPGLPGERLHQWSQHNWQGSERRPWNPYPRKGLTCQMLKTHHITLATSMEWGIWICFFSLLSFRKKCILPAGIFCSNPWPLRGQTTTSRCRAFSGGPVCSSSSSSALGTTQGCWCSHGSLTTWGHLNLA